MTATAPTLVDILAAKGRLARFLRPTPLLHSPWLSSIADATVHVKIECVQLSNSFKIRGAFNALLHLLEESGSSAPPLVVTASAGNHGRALALAGERLGLRVIVYTPRTAPETKKAAIGRHGAELRDHEPDYDAAERAARACADAEGALYISPYNHADVIAGAATAALEVLEQLPDFDVLVAPLGGGGLVSGLGLALEGAAPHVQIVGVETAASTPFAVSLANGRLTEIDPGLSLADGLTGNLEPGSITFELVRRVIDRVVSVDEEALARAIRGLAAEEHLIAEGAGATATAGVLAANAVAPGQRAVVMVTGGNIDVARLAKILCPD
jgi:threonine dehydratase